jgi:hypothetical protein
MTAVSGSGVSMLSIGSKNCFCALVESAARAVERELHDRGIERRAVVELHVRTQLEV